MLFGILLTVQIIICVSMGGLILVQRSEGGALGMGGGPSGFMSARGAGNLLTKATAILAVLFFINCIGLTIVGNIQNKERSASAVDKIDTSTLKLNAPAQTAPAQAAASSSKAPSLSDLPLVSPTAPVTAPAKPVAASAASAASSSAAKP